jgi:hypothetical protein
VTLLKGVQGEDLADAIKSVGNDRPRIHGNDRYKTGFVVVRHFSLQAPRGLLEFSAYAEGQCSILSLF